MFDENAVRETVDDFIFEFNLAPFGNEDVAYRFLVDNQNLLLSDAAIAYMQRLCHTAQYHGALDPAFVAFHKKIMEITNVTSEVVDMFRATLEILEVSRLRGINATWDNYLFASNCSIEDVERFVSGTLEDAYNELCKRKDGLFTQTAMNIIRHAVEGVRSEGAFQEASRVEQRLQLLIDAKQNGIEPAWDRYVRSLH